MKSPVKRPKAGEIAVMHVLSALLWSACTGTEREALLGAGREAADIFLCSPRCAVEYRAAFDAAAERVRALPVSPTFAQCARALRPATSIIERASGQTERGWHP